MSQERRRTPRYSFIANAEIIEEASGAKMATRVSELSLYGCYFDMVNPLPNGTPVKVKIFTDDGFFESRAAVVYSVQNMGMGVTFRDVSPHFLPILRKWLMKAMVGSKTGGGETVG